MSVADELGKLADLRDRGVLSEEEFGRQKAQLLGDPTITDDANGDVPEPSAIPGGQRSERISTGDGPRRFSVEGRNPRQRMSDKAVVSGWIVFAFCAFVFISLAIAFGLGTGGM